MSDLDSQMFIRCNKKKRAQFEKLAQSYGLTGSALMRVMMDAAIDRTLRIVESEKTTVKLSGVHINA